jgi:hypothetical protein
MKGRPLGAGDLMAVSRQKERGPVEAIWFDDVCAGVEIKLRRVALAVDEDADEADVGGSMLMAVRKGVDAAEVWAQWCEWCRGGKDDQSAPVGCRSRVRWASSPLPLPLPQLRMSDGSFEQCRADAMHTGQACQRCPWMRCVGDLMWLG